MHFKFLTDEVDEVLNLINPIFGMHGTKETFKLYDNQRMLLLKDGDKVIGSVIITIKHDPIQNTKFFYLDYACISPNYQHQGLGKKMYREVERIAREENADAIQLTSNPKREIARKLYMSEGMTMLDTNIFIKRLK